MKENSETIQHLWYEGLRESYESAIPTTSLAETAGELSIDEAYHVQELLIADRIERGERIIGWKIGATSRSVMEQLGISEPILGCMTTGSEYSPLREVKASSFCKLAVEAEIAIVIGRDIEGPGVTTADVLRATEGVLGAVELVDCRIKDWQMTREEAIADNALHGGIILGSVMRSPKDMDLSMEGVALTKNGNLLASACGIEVLGNPLNVVVWLANKFASRDKILKEGDIVSTGSLTKFFFLQPGDVIDVRFAHLGSIGFSLGK